MTGSRRLAASALVVLLAAAACSSGSSQSVVAPTTADSSVPVATKAVSKPGSKYVATIRRTTDGVPHVMATDVPSVVFGDGWASAEDHACTLADQLLKVQGRRAEFLGAGDNDANTKSDFAWRTIGIDTRARAEFSKLSADAQTEMTAFADGWSAAVAKIGGDKLNGWCAGQSWVKSITGPDVYAYARSVALNASSTQLVRYLGSAQPPAATASIAGDARRGPVDLTGVTAAPVASNAWAIGQDRSSGASAMLLANPHFPWEGELRFWEVQLTVPGKLDVYGAQLVGLPGVGIGFTAGVAWSHTVSAGKRFTAYTLDLVPGNPTSYRYDGGERAMTSAELGVKVKQADGSTTESKRTVWSSHYGPILDFPGIGWSTTMTTTYRDANIDNSAFVEQYLAMDQATDLASFQAAHEKYQGVPLFNTIAVGKDGKAWYADTSATPNLSKAALDAYAAAKVANPITSIAADNSVVLLDGSNSLYEWVDEPGARSPGLIPYSRMPKVERSDYVFNANDSYWMNNADHPLTGDFSPLQGAAAAPLIPRTRENAMVLRDISATGPSGADGKFTLDELKAAALLDRGASAAFLKDGVVNRCRNLTVVAVPELQHDDGTVALPADSVDVSKACEVLRSWDGVYDVSSRGAALWREFLLRFPRDQLGLNGPLWGTAFDASKPIDTPAGLAAGSDDTVAQNLARAAQILAKAGFAIDAPLGDLQYTDRSGTRIAIPGGTDVDGTTNVVGWSSGNSHTGEPVPVRGPRVAPGSNLTASGYPVNNGSSFIMTTEFTASGPRAFSILTYGNTGNRTSPFFASQTTRFSEKNWKPVAFTEADIAADKALVSESVS